MDMHQYNKNMYTNLKVSAVAVLSDMNMKKFGTIRFYEQNNKIKYKLDINPKYKIYIHKYGDLSNMSNISKDILFELNSDKIININQIIGRLAIVYEQDKNIQLACGVIGIAMPQIM